MKIESITLSDNGRKITLEPIKGESGCLRITFPDGQIRENTNMTNDAEAWDLAIDLAIAVYGSRKQNTPGARSMPTATNSMIHFIYNHARDVAGC